MNKEALSYKESKIAIIFGVHSIADNAEKQYNTFCSSINADGRYPGFSLWPKTTEDDLSGKKPTIVAVDSISFDPKYFSGEYHIYDLAWFPGNPFDLKKKSGKLQIVGADLPYGLPCAVESQEDPLKIKTDEKGADWAVGRMVADYVSDTVGTSALEDANLYINKFKIEKLAMPSELIPLFLAFVTSSELQSRSDDTKMTRRKFLKATTGIFAGLYMADILRILSYRIDPKLPLNKPIGTTIWDAFRQTPSDWVSLRNALVFLKTKEIEYHFQSEGSLEKSAIVFGNGHNLDDGVFNNAPKAKQKIKKELGRMFDKLQLDDSSLSKKEQLDFRVLIAKRLAEYLGSSSLWEVGEEPEIYSEKSISESIKLTKTFKSPSVYSAVREVVIEKGFLPADFSLSAN